MIKGPETYEEKLAEKSETKIDVLRLKERDRPFVKEISDYLYDTDLQVELREPPINNKLDYSRIVLVAIGHTEDVLDASNGIQGYDDRIQPFSPVSKHGLEYQVKLLSSFRKPVNDRTIKAKISDEFYISIGSRENSSFVSSTEVSPIHLTITNEGFKDDSLIHGGFIFYSQNKNRFEKNLREFKEKYGDMLKKK